MSLLLAHAAWALPDLGVVKTGPAQAAPGDLVSYTLTYTNAGSVNGVDVVLQDFLPAYTTVLTNTLSGGTLAGSTISWSLGSVASNAGGSRSFQVRVNTNTLSGLYITNRAQIFGSEAEEPGNTNDNYATLITRVSSPPLPDFCRAILAKQPISLHGTMLIDSFNSRDPNFSTNGKYDPAKHGDGGNVASISDSLTVITDTGNTEVYGRFETGPSGTVRIMGTASVGSLAWVDGGNRGIQPGWYSTNLNVIIPDAALPSAVFAALPRNSGTVGGTNYTYVLNSGNYSRSQDLTLSSSENMVINGNVVLYFQKKLTISGSAYIYITPGSKLTVYLTGIASLAGGGTVNGTGFATNCAYVGLPACASISFSGNSEYIGTVYAPQATVQMSGGGAQVVNFIGSVVANAVDVTGNYQFHYDQDLCRECLPPTVESAPLSLTNCPGTTASFSVSARGTDLQYAWFKENAALAAQTNSTLILTNVSANDGGTYRVVVSVPCGDAVTNSATLTVNTPVNATELVSLNRTTGGTASFGTLAVGTGPFSYVWKKNDVVIPGQTGSSLTLTNITRADAGAYSVEASGACGSVIRTATLTVLNSAPVAADDAYATPEDTTLMISAPGFLANDSDPDGDALTGQLVTGPTHGTLTFGTSGNFTYLPELNYTGGDSFTYRAFDGQTNSNVATVHITVAPLNDLPVALNDAYTTPEDTALDVSAPGVLLNDSDPDGDALTAMLTSSPIHGTLTFNATGDFTYVPAPHFNGVDHFTYWALDGTTKSVNIATVTITVTPVNDPPVAVNDSYTTPEDTTLNVASPGVLSNDSDSDADALEAVLVTAPAHGTLTLNTNGSFSYTPTTNFVGGDSFTYLANDGITNSGIATATITVTPLNDAPIAANDNYTTPEDTTLNIAAPGVLGNDMDPDGDALKAILITVPWHGTLTLNTNGSFSYTPATNYVGGDSFTYIANDGITNSGIATATIMVTPMNDAPIAANDNYTTPEDTTLNVAAPGVLVNDSDPDGDELKAILVTGPTHGTLTVNMNGSFAYTPASNYVGGDIFTYKANAGIADSSVATVTITVTPVNDPPVAEDDSYTVNEDTTLEVHAPGILANDSDPDGDILTAIRIDGPAHGTLTLGTNGNFTYRAALNYTGSDSFTYRALDGKTNSNIATVRLTINAVNDRPVAVNDTYTTPEDTALNIPAPGVLANDTDVDGDPLSAVFMSGPAHGTLTFNANGSFSYLPTNHYNGLDTFSYRAFDGRTNSENATVTITVTPANDPPLAINDSYVTAEDTTLTIPAPGVLTNDTDVDGDALTAILVSNPAHGVLTLNTNGSFTYQPATNYNGSDSFAYHASDGTASSGTATVTITVTPVNDPPEANTDNYTTLEDTVLTIAAPGVLGNDTDVDGDTLTARLETSPLHGTITLNANGAFSYFPAPDYYGPDTFTYFASDGRPPVRLATVNITVLPVNDPPVFTKGADQLVQENAGTQVVAGWATGIVPGPANESSQAVTFQLFSDNTALFAVQPAVAANGTLTYTPATNAYGVADVRIIAHDDGGTANGGVDTSAPQTFAIIVNAPPTVEIASPTNGSIFIAPANFNVIADARDVDGTVAKVEFFEQTNKLGEVTFGQEPLIGQTNLPAGTYTFSAIATDNLNARGTSAPVTITVMERPPLTVISGLHYNPQTDFFEERVRVTNPTYSTFDAVRVWVFNLTNSPPITVHNPTGFTNGIPYIQSYAAVPPNSYVDMTIEYYSPLRIMPNPILRPELVSPRPVPPGNLSGTLQHINRGFLSANKTFLVEFATLFNRTYVVQYSADLQNWKSSEPFVMGDGGWVQWIDNGLPKTDSPPAEQSARFYRVLLLP